MFFKIKRNYSKRPTGTVLDGFVWIFDMIDAKRLRGSDYVDIMLLPMNGYDVR